MHHQHAVSVSIPKPQVLAIRQILKRMLLALLLIHGQRISPRILAPQNNIQTRRDAHQNRIAANDTLPNTRVVVADILGSNPEWADNVACQKSASKILKVRLLVRAIASNRPP